MAGIRIGEAAHPGPLTFFEELDANLDDHEANGPMPDSDDEFIPYLADSSSDEGERNVADDSTCGLIVGPKKHVVNAKAFRDNPLFVPAPWFRGKPKHGGNVEGYVFATRRGKTGYFRDGEYDRHEESLIALEHRG